MPPHLLKSGNFGCIEGCALDRSKTWLHFSLSVQECTKATSPHSTCARTVRVCTCTRTELSAMCMGSGHNNSNNSDALHWNRDTKRSHHMWQFFFAFEPILLALNSQPHTKAAAKSLNPRSHCYSGSSSVKLTREEARVVRTSHKGQKSDR